MITRTSFALNETAPTTRRVLFDCPGAWPVLSESATGGIGGAELRAITFAKQLAKEPTLDVHILVRSTDDRANHVVPALLEQLTVHFEPPSTTAVSTPENAWRRTAQRFSRRLGESLGKRLVGVPERRRVLEALDFDLLCCFGVTNRTAGLVRTARLLQRPVCVFLTSDRTLTDMHRKGRRHRGIYGELGWMVRYALNQADEVVVQKRTQQRVLQDELGIAARLIRNPIDLSTTASEPPIGLPATPFALWVGRADSFSKRADLCWKLARQCPEIPFVAIVNRHNEMEFQQLISTQPSNVTLIPFVAPSRIEAYYRQATLLINTSDAEGFPNSFLQAGKYGVPILSLNVDPDGMFSEHSAGICCGGSLATMRDQLRMLKPTSSIYQHLSQNAWSYTRRFHDLSQSSQQLSNLIHALLATNVFVSTQ